MRILGRFCLVVVQAILIFGSEMWVLTPCISRNWEIFTTGSQGKSREATSETIQWNLEVPPVGRVDVRGRVGGTVNVDLYKVQHGGPVHMNKYHLIPVTGSIEADGSTGGAEVVESGGDQFYGSSGGREGGVDGGYGMVG